MLGVEIYEDDFWWFSRGGLIGALSVGDCGFGPRYVPPCQTLSKNGLAQKVSQRVTASSAFQPRCLKSLAAERSHLHLSFRFEPRTSRLEFADKEPYRNF